MHPALPGAATALPAGSSEKPWRGFPMSRSHSFSVGVGPRRGTGKPRLLSQCNWMSLDHREADVTCADESLSQTCQWVPLTFPPLNKTTEVGGW